MEEYGLNSKFNIDQHKEHFIHYLEVVIRTDGTVEYAVPSHQEKLIAIAMEKLDCTREELYAKCPIEFYFDVTAWLCLITGCVSVWETYTVGIFNNAQLKALQELEAAGLYIGE